MKSLLFYLGLFSFLILLTSCSRNTLGCNSYSGRNSTFKYRDRNKKVKVYKSKSAIKFELYRHRDSEPISN